MCKQNATQTSQSVDDRIQDGQDVSLRLFPSNICYIRSVRQPTMKSLQRYCMLVILLSAFLQVFCNTCANKESKRGCGGVLTKSSLGIVHKPFENILQNERCVWVIAVPGALDYNFNIIRLSSGTNKPDGGQGLILTGYALGSPPKVQSNLPTSKGTFQIHNSNFVTVTFFSSHATLDNNHGFILSYSSIQAGVTQSSSNQSNHFIMTSPVFDIKYPHLGQNYASSELSAFVFLPPENVYDGKLRHAFIKIHGMESGCSDALYLYTLSVNASQNVARWKPNGRICAETHAALIEFDDASLLLFNSDGSGVGTGFAYWYFVC